MGAMVMFLAYGVIFAGMVYALILRQVLKRIARHEADYSLPKCVLLTVSMLMAHLLVPYVLRSHLPDELIWVARAVAWVAVVFLVKWLAWVRLSKAVVAVGIMLVLHLLLAFGLDAGRASRESRRAQIPSVYNVYEAIANWEASRLDVSRQLAGILDVMPPRLQVARVIMHSRHEDTVFPSVVFTGSVRGYANSVTAEQDVARLPPLFMANDGPGAPLTSVELVACVPDPRAGTPPEYRMFDLELLYAPLPLQGHAAAAIPTGTGRKAQPREEGVSRLQMISLLVMSRRIVLQAQEDGPSQLAAEFIRRVADEADVTVLSIEDQGVHPYRLVEMKAELLTGLRQYVGLRGSVRSLIELLEQVGQSPAGRVVKVDFQQASESDAWLYVTIDWPVWAAAYKDRIQRILPP